MKKYISVILAVLICVLAFSGCGNIFNPAGQESTSELNWEEKDINLKEILPKLNTITVSPYSNLEISLVDSPFKFSAEELVKKLSESSVFSDYVITKKVEEIGNRDTKRLGDVSVNRLDTVYCYQKGSSVPEFYIDMTRCLPTTVGITGIHINLLSENTKENPAQTKWEELFTAVFGEKIGNAVLYAKDGDSEWMGSKKSTLHEKVLFEDTGHYYTVYRNLNQSENGTLSGDFQLNISSGATNMYNAYMGEYKTISSDMKYNPANLFAGKLGEKSTIMPTEVWDKYMALDETEGTVILDSYSCSIAELPDGGYMYDYALTVHKSIEKTRIATQYESANLSVLFSVTEDKDGNIADYNYTIKGKPQNIKKAEKDEEILEEKEEKFEQLLEDIKKQLSLIFGSNIDLSKLTINDFEIVESSGEPFDIGQQSKTTGVSPSYLSSIENRQWGEVYGYLGEIKRVATVPASFDFFGKMLTIDVEITLIANSDDWIGQWEFAVHSIPQR